MKKKSSNIFKNEKLFHTFLQQCVVDVFVSNILQTREFGLLLEEKK